MKTERRIGLHGVVHDALTLGLAFALFLQGLLAAAHMHPLPATAQLGVATVSQAALTASETRTAIDNGATAAAVNDDEALCPICQVLRGAASFVAMPAPLLTLAETFALPLPQPDPERQGGRSVTLPEARAPPRA